MVEKLILKLIKKSYESERVERLSFVVIDPIPWSFLPGQFVVMLLEHGGIIHKRSYSLISNPRSAEIELVYTYLPGGVASEYFKNMQIGDLVNANGPSGKFTIVAEPGLRYIWLATGTGIGPFCSMLQTIDFNDSTVEILFGIRSIDELICKDILQNAINNNANIKLHYCFSQNLPRQVEKAKYNKGYVQECLAMFGLDLVKDRFYLCGNPAMVDACANILVKAGVINANIHREKYVVTGLSSKRSR
jgi:ferredoxin-NADP reductase